MHPLDLCATFGPLASMHAALDAAGGGMPCAVTAWFEGVAEEELRHHLLAAASGFPLLASRLAWSGGRPVLLPGSGSPIAATAPLDFRATDAPLAWRAAMRADARGSSLSAVFSHTMADGGSMLRLIAEIERRLGVQDPAILPEAPARLARPRVLPWLAGFFAERLKSHLVLAPDDAAPMGATWFRTGPEARDRVLARARSACGRMLPFLTAATALTAAELSVGGRRRVSLYIPIARGNLDAFEGFGFGVGSILIGQEVPPSIDVTALAKTLADRLGREVAAGWDGGLEWFLGPKPQRHERFARLRAHSRPDPAINVSWKGFRRGLGAAGGASNLACFGAAPTGHVSAHADMGGLSLSFTAPKSAELRSAFLKALACHLGIEEDVAFRTYGDDTNCSAAKSA